MGVVCVYGVCVRPCALANVTSARMRAVKRHMPRWPPERSSTLVKIAKSRSTLAFCQLMNRIEVYNTPSCMSVLMDVTIVLKAPAMVRILLSYDLS